MQNTSNIKYWQHKYDYEPEIYFKFVQNLKNEYIWVHFVKYVKDKTEKFEEYVPNLKKINIDFGSLVINDENYAVCKFLCESPQMTKLCLQFKNLQMHKDKNNFTKLIFPQYMVENAEIPNQILSNLPTNTEKITINFTHINLVPYCFTHERTFCKLLDCSSQTPNTIVFEPSVFTNLPYLKSV